MKVFDVFAAKMKNLSRAIINGKEYCGKSISIQSNGYIIIDGQIEGSVVGSVSVMLTGDCNALSNVSGDIKITGSVSGDVSTTSGNVECQNIDGNAETVSGGIQVSGSVGGDVETVSGDVHASSINGRAETLSGDISDKFYHK